MIKLMLELKKNTEILKKIIGLCVVFALSFCFAQVIQADELSELKEQMKAIKKQIQAQQKTIEAIQKRIDIVETEKAEKASKTMPANGNGISDWMNKVEVGYKKGLYIETKDKKHSLHWRFLFQPQYEFVHAESADNTNTFLMKRAQIRIFGNVLDPRLTYKFMLMEASSSSGEGDMNLRDAWINWKVLDYFQVRVGQHSLWYDYEDIQPFWVLSLVDRSIINANFKEI